MRAWLPAVTWDLPWAAFSTGFCCTRSCMAPSSQPGAGMDDLRLQILWDGYFHAAMYAVALVGLAALWRHRSVIGADPRRRLWAMLPVGFGLWHGIDAVLSHWVLGIHRIRDDSPVPAAVGCGLADRVRHPARGRGIVRGDGATRPEGRSGASRPRCWR